MSDTYICYKCNGVFTKGWSNEEALDEMGKNNLGPPGEAANQKIETLCDDCYKKFLRWRILQ